MFSGNDLDPDQPHSPPPNKKPLVDLCEWRNHRVLARRDNVYTPGVIKEIQMNRHVGIQQDEDKQTVYYRDVIETRYLLRETLMIQLFC